MSWRSHGGCPNDSCGYLPGAALRQSLAVLLSALVTLAVTSLVAATVNGALGYGYS